MPSKDSSGIHKSLIRDNSIKIKSASIFERLLKDFGNRFLK
jgi:hypothetical protein